MFPLDDLKVEAWPPRQGGQQVGPGPCGVKVTHLPTGTEACCAFARSQYTNKMIAMEMILAAITHPKFGR